jgi:phosphoribosylformylglycinamidine synthase
MAVVVDAKDVDKFIAAAEAENLEAYRVATVTESPRMVMHWKGQKIADLSREFLNTNGAAKHAKASVPEKDRSAMAGRLRSRITSSAEIIRLIMRCPRSGNTRLLDGGNP